MTSANDILKKHGKWITSGQLKSKLTDCIMASRNLKKQSAERIAYRNIRKEVKAGLVRKVTLPDRSVLYGLPDWPIETITDRTLSEAERAERARYAEFYAKAEFVAEEFPNEGFGGLKDYAEILRKKRKEAGLE